MGEDDDQIRPEVLAELADAGWFNHDVPRWQDAACSTAPDPDLWFTQTYAAQRDAIKVCEECPIQAQCGSYGLKYHTEGVWGGVALKPARVPMWARADSPCKKGHFDWYYFTDSQGRERRRCAECQRLRESAKKELVAA